MKEQNLSDNLVMMFFRVTPVPIPNTTVKPLEADGTARETVWESRWSPGQYSSIAQWWSTRLLTDRLEVRVLFEEPNLVMMRLRVTPVPIPNTTVKPLTVDGTARETVWESRWSLGKIKLEF